MPQQPAPQTAPRVLDEAGARLDVRRVQGCLVELVAGAAPANLSQAVALLLHAQRAGEPCAWVSCRPTPFFAPDLAEAGLDLDALPIVVARSAAQAGRAADKLLRSGGFGLVVVDLHEQRQLPTPLLSRLAALCRQHRSALIFLTPAPAVGACQSLGSLISLRAVASRVVDEDGAFCHLDALKDRRRGGGWSQRQRADLFLSW